MKNFLQRFKKFPFFHWLLPVFFVLHGFTDFYPFIPLKESSYLLLIYLFSVFVLFGLFYFFYKNSFKAALFVFLLMCFYFFFGPVHDALKSWTANGFISRYSFILPASLIFFITSFIVIKKRKKDLSTPTGYLNILMIVLLITELISLSMKLSYSSSQSSQLANEFKPCTECKKPDIWLIIADGYAGKQELDSVLHYDNSGFENQLRQRGFYLPENSISNYNFTPFSIASLLNMNFINGIKGKNSDKEDLKICFGAINTNSTLQFLKNHGYQFYNYSIFDFDGQPSLARPTFLPTKTKPLVSQTFLYRFQNDLWFHLVTDLKLSSQRNKSLYHDRENNNKFYQLTHDLAEKKNSSPKFVYTHLMMPHYPYYYDSIGNERPFEKITENNANDTAAYISYLKYANKKLLSLTDSILKTSVEPPTIIIMGDHGLRELNFKIDKQYYYSALNAILLPGKNYSGFYNGMSHVNQFRTLLNTEFKQQLKMLPDSTVLVIE
jgi:hypothetical protein